MKVKKVSGFEFYYELSDGARYTCSNSDYTVWVDTNGNYYITEGGTPSKATGNIVAEGDSLEWVISFFEGVWSELNSEDNPETRFINLSEDEYYYGLDYAIDNGDFTVWRKAGTQEIVVMEGFRIPNEDTLNYFYVGDIKVYPHFLPRCDTLKE